MPGKRQHYIPQQLQRGFLAGELGGADRTWLHRSGCTPKLVGIRDVGVSEYFYSKPSLDGSPTLDDQITEIEDEVRVCLEKLRAIVEPSSFDSKAAAHLVAHLTFRTAHVRSTLTQGAMLVLDRVTDFVADDERMRKHLGVDGLRSGETSSDQIEQAISSLPFENLQAPPDLVKRVARFFIREKFSDIFEEAKPELASAMSAIGERLSDSVEEGHKKALSCIETTNRERDLAGFSWSVQIVSGALLPDCIAIAYESGCYAPLLLSNLNSVDHVVLPVSHNRLLVGSRESIEDIPVSVVNEASAVCSDHFFISRLASDGEGLSSSIGQRCAQALSEHVHAAVSRFDNSIPTSECQTGEDAGTPHRSASRAISFSMSCIGFGDQDVAEKLSETLKSLVMELSCTLPLGSLEGVTFASDYSAAVAQLDSSYSGSHVREYGRAIAKCIHVTRDGRIAKHIVFDLVVAEQLLSDQEEIRRDGLRVVTSMLSQVAHGSLFGTKFPVQTPSALDEVSKLLYPCISSVPAAYFAARESASVAPDAGDQYARLVIDSYRCMRDELRLARLAYRQDGNLDGLIATALTNVVHVLEHTAAWLGHRDGLPDGIPFRGADLVKDLGPHDLGRWVELFGRDLRNAHAGETLALDQIITLCSHAERLLWTVQICPWITAESKAYVSVPVGIDE